MTKLKFRFHFPKFGHYQFMLGWVVVLLVSFSTSLTADILYLKNGRVMLGKIIKVDGEQVRFRAESRTHNFSKSQVKKISYSPVEEKAIIQKRVQARNAWIAKRKKEIEEQKKPPVTEITQFDFKEKITKEDLNTGVVSPWAIIARSALVPGWGHLAMDEAVLGWGYMAGFGILVSNSAYKRNLAERGLLDYRRSVAYQNMIIFGLPGLGTPAQRVALASFMNGEDHKRSRVGVKQYNQSLAILIGYYALQLVHSSWDAFYFGDDANWDLEINTDSKPSPGSKINFENHRPEMDPNTFPLLDNRFDLRITIRYVTDLTG